MSKCAKFWDKKSTTFSNAGTSDNGSATHCGVCGRALLLDDCGESDWPMPGDGRPGSGCTNPADCCAVSGWIHTCLHRSAQACPRFAHTSGIPRSLNESVMTFALFTPS